MTTEQQIADPNVIGPRVLTGFVYYNENDDLAKIFDVIKDFRVRHGLKYSHYKGYIFFMMSSEFLDEFSKVRPFRISKFKSSSEYSCSKDVADKLIEQRNSFIKMRWDESGITFRSRTKTFFHNHLVRKLFKDAEIELNQESYTVHRFNQEDEVNRVEGEQEVKTQNQSKGNTEEFVKVENKRGRKPKTQDFNNDFESKSKTKYTPKVKVQKETDSKEAPKIRGVRTGANKTK